MKPRNILLSMLLVAGGTADAINYDRMEPLKLTTPTMEPTTAALLNEEQRLRDEALNHYTAYSDHAPWKKENWTWMRSNPGVKPYKVMDDLTFVGVPVFFAGMLAKGAKKAFRQNQEGNKHTLLTDFRTSIDNYTQYFGPVLTTGLKIGGVEGRSDWGRYLATTAMAYGIMAGFVNGIKYTVKEMRPDGSTANSWPSGHTATAFVGATILHKEYGMTRSPWYSVAGFGVATATGVMRVMNNRHWVSDVLSGAGIGIMSTELAYALSDVFFKGRGLLRGDISGEKSIIYDPSFFSISMGIGFGCRNLEFDMQKFHLDGYGDGEGNLKLKFGASTAVGAEGAYFFNKYIGVGGRLRINAASVNGWEGVENYAWSDLVWGLYREDYAKSDDVKRFIDGAGKPGEDGYSPELVEDASFHVKSNHLTEFTADLGVYFNLPMSRYFALGSKLLVGRSVMQEVDLTATVTGGRRELERDADDVYAHIKLLPDKYTSEWDYFTVGGNNTTKCGTGISLTYAYKENYAWRVFLDYDFSRKTYTMTYNPAEFLLDAIGMRDNTNARFPHLDSDTQSVTKNRHTFVLGGSFTVSF